MHLGDRNHRRIERRHVARHHALQGRDDLGGDDHRVDATLRSRAVRALAGDFYVEQSAAGHLRAGADGELADVELGPVVHAEDLFAGELVEQPVLDHGLGAATAFLGRLEDEVHGAVEVTGRRKILGGPQQHGGVTVVAARMHAALVRAAMVEGVELVHRQRIHVGAQADGAWIVADPDGADDTGLADAGRHFQAPLLQLLGHDGAGPLFLEAQFGMGMNVAPDGGQLVSEGGDLGLDVHGGEDSNRKAVITRRNSAPCTFGYAWPPSATT